MSESNDSVFSALADPTRRQILEWLDGGEDPLTATALASRLPITRQAVTKHLKELESAGLVSSVREGRETRYSATIDGLDTAAVWLAARGAVWDERLARLSESANGREDASSAMVHDPGASSEYIYHFEPGPRPELATNPDAWTAEDVEVGAAHFAYLSQMAEEGIVILAGRSQDGVGPAIVIFEADDLGDARRFMERDPFISHGLFTGSLHPFNTALMRIP
jgi:DNA-binding transcriptional ArsR family regulator/uncharacterized protein YciI